jgi:hypothetical protein
MTSFDSRLSISRLPLRSQALLDIGEHNDRNGMAPSLRWKQSQPTRAPLETGRGTEPLHRVDGLIRRPSLAPPETAGEAPEK